MRRRFVVLFLAVVCILLGCAIVQQINAARFSGSIKSALESSLGRKVVFEAAYFSVFSGPGFALEKVTISEDPSYGIEPFAYVPTLQARIRLDKLLLGQIRFTSLRLVEPSLNLVKRDDGHWNVVELIQRLSAPRRAPLNLFPSFEVSDGRVDFKFETRKTTLYISESDLSIYPERSGKVYIRFSGSPARTDRAGMGFGHFRGSMNWFLNSAARGRNRLQAEVNLDRSNLSELTTLLEGHDIGVHGTVSSRVRIDGPLTGLRVAGELRLDDVHRWDLLPASGEDWAVHFGGDLDLPAHRIDLRTESSQESQSTPLTMQVRVNDFLGHSNSMITAELKDAPLQDLLPLALRMGVPLPSGAEVRGSLNGQIGYASAAGWTGKVLISNAEAILQGAPKLRAAVATVQVAGDHLHFDPAAIDAGFAGTLMLGGDYYFSGHEAKASMEATDVPVNVLKPITRFWLGGLDTLSGMTDGSITGQILFARDDTAATATGNPRSASWSGQLELNDGTVSIPGLAVPLERSHGRIVFNNSSFEITHFTASLGPRLVRASYRYNLLAKRTEHARIVFPEVDLSELEGLVSSPDQGEGLWARLRFFRRSSPNWLRTRNLEGELLVDRLLADGQLLGSLSSHFIWQGAALDWSNVRLDLAHGQIVAQGAVNLSSSLPKWQFTARASGYPWGGGSLDAEGQFSSMGAGKDLLRNLIAEGSFSGEDVSLSMNDSFEQVAGLFQFSFADGWPDLRLLNIQATEDGDQWSGAGSTQSDGKLLVDLSHGDQQIHLVSSLAGKSTSDPVSKLLKKLIPVRLLFGRLEF